MSCPKTEDCISRVFVYVTSVLNLTIAILLLVLLSITPSPLCSSSRVLADESLRAVATLNILLIGKQIQPTENDSRSNTIVLKLKY